MEDGCWYDVELCSEDIYTEEEVIHKIDRRNTHQEDTFSPGCANVNVVITFNSEIA